MRILLVRPRRLDVMTVFGQIVCEPLELEHLLPACRAFGEAQIYDGIVEGRAFTEVLREFRPDVVGITGYLTQEREMRAYVRLSRRTCPGCAVVLGGTHAQLNYRRLYWPEVDYVFRGESVEDFSRLLAALDRGERPAGIPGLCAREGAGFREEPYVPCDVDRLPMPDRRGWEERADWYRYLDWPRISTMKTAVSCPFSCDFCYGRGLHGGIYQARRLDLVLDELEEIPGETVFLVDSDFLVDPARVAALLDGLEERRIRKQFICYARADFIAAHPDLTARLCRAGFRAFLVGIEGIRDDRLRAWDKGTSRGTNETCVRILREEGADCVALLLADPAFRREDFRALYRWVRDMGLRYASVQILTPIPPTPFYQRKSGELLSEDLRKWDLNHLLLEPEHMGRRAFLRRYRLLMARLVWLGWRRGAYRFVGPAYLAGVAGKWLRRWRTLA